MSLKPALLKPAGATTLVPILVIACSGFCKFIVSELKIPSVISSPAPIQVAVSKAIEIADSTSYFEDMRIQYKKKYEILQSVFDELNIPYTKADGGYFLLVNFKKVKMPELDWPELIANKPRDFKLTAKVYISFTSTSPTL